MTLVRVGHRLQRLMVSLGLAMDLEKPLSKMGEDSSTSFALGVGPAFMFRNQFPLLRLGPNE